MVLDLAKTVAAGGRVEATLPLGRLSWERGADIPVTPVRLEGRLNRIRKGYEFAAHLSARLGLDCVRCLEPFDQPLDSDFQLLFAPGPMDEDQAVSQVQPGGCDLFPCVDDKVDLSAVVLEQVYLQVPLKPVCSPTCRGLCLSCGENLDRGSCRCPEPATVRVV